jgi:hypothetical protein
MLESSFPLLNTDSILDFVYNISGFMTFYLRLSSSISHFCCAFSLNLHFKFFSVVLYIISHVQFVSVDTIVSVYRFKIMREINSCILFPAMVILTRHHMRNKPSQFMYLVVLIYHRNSKIT